MRIVLFCAMLLCSLLVAEATVWTVTVTDFSFTPADLNISLGDTVVWNSILGTHNVLEACGTPLFGNAVAPAPWQYSFVFSTGNGVSPGTYAYFCETHPDIMWGAIRVAPTPHRVNITVTDFQFIPANATVAVGDTVVWTRVQGFHNVSHLDDNPRFHNDIGDTWTTYEWPCTVSVGTYPYICEVHFPDMAGTLNVIPAQNAPASPQGFVFRGNASDATLRWNRVPGASCYLIYQSNTATGPFSRIVAASADTFFVYAGGTAVLPRSFLRVTALNN